MLGLEATHYKLIPSTPSTRTHVGQAASVDFVVHDFTLNPYTRGPGHKADSVFHDCPPQPVHAWARQPHDFNGFVRPSTRTRMGQASASRLRSPGIALNPYTRGPGLECTLKRHFPGPQPVHAWARHINLPNEVTNCVRVPMLLGLLVNVDKRRDLRRPITTLTLYAFFPTSIFMWI